MFKYSTGSLVWLALCVTIPVALGQNPAKENKREAKARAKAEREIAKAQPKIDRAQAKLDKEQAKANARAAKERAKMQPKIDRAGRRLQQAQSKSSRGKNSAKAQAEIQRASAQLGTLQAEANARAAEAYRSLEPSIGQASAKLQKERAAANERAQRAYASAGGRSQAPVSGSAVVGFGGTNAAGSVAIPSAAASMGGSAVFAGAGTVIAPPTASDPSSACRQDTTCRGWLAQAEAGSIRANYEAAAWMIQWTLNSGDPGINRAELEQMLATMRQQAAQLDSNAVVIGTGPSVQQAPKIGPAPKPITTKSSDPCAGVGPHCSGKAQ
jgi:hypothetical protein